MSTQEFAIIVPGKLAKLFPLLLGLLLPLVAGVLGWSLHRLTIVLSNPDPVVRRGDSVAARG